VSCTTVHPGGIKTNIAKNMRGDHAMAGNFDRIAMTKPARAAREILAAVKANRRRALIGPDANVIDFLARLPGSFLHRVIAFGARRRGL
jgi:short-subunit dehydrogenase